FSPSIAVRWLRRSVHQGNPWAHFYLGMCYANGLGVEQSFRKAAKFYRIAAEGGDSGGANNLAALYEYGRGVKRSARCAAVWRRRTRRLQERERRNRITS